MSTMTTEEITVTQTRGLCQWVWDDARGESGAFTSPENNIFVVGRLAVVAVLDRRRHHAHVPDFQVTLRQFGEKRTVNSRSLVGPFFTDSPPTFRDPRPIVEWARWMEEKEVPEYSDDDHACPDATIDLRLEWARYRGLPVKPESFTNEKKVNLEWFMSARKRRIETDAKLVCGVDLRPCFEHDFHGCEPWSDAEEHLRSSLGPAAVMHRQMRPKTAAVHAVLQFAACWAGGVEGLVSEAWDQRKTTTDQKRIACFRRLKEASDGYCERF